MKKAYKKPKVKDIKVLCAIVKAKQTNCSGTN